MELIHNDFGKEAITKQFQTMRRQKTLALACLLLLPLGLLLPGWLKLTAIIPLCSAFFLDQYARNTYEVLLYKERDKEKLALYLRDMLPDNKIWVNPQCCSPAPHLMTIGPTGVFIILITPKLSYDMTRKADIGAMAVQAALQHLIPAYPVKTMIYFSEATLLKPAVGRITIVSSLFSLIKHIQNHNQRISQGEIQALADRFQGRTDPTNDEAVIDSPEIFDELPLPDLSD